MSKFIKAVSSAASAARALCDAVVAKIALGTVPWVGRANRAYPEIVWTIEGDGQTVTRERQWAVRSTRTLAEHTLGEEPIFGRLHVLPREEGLDWMLHRTRVRLTREAILGSTHYVDGRPVVVIGSDANMAKQSRFVLGSPGARARAEEFFSTAEGLSVYLNILISEVKKSFVIPEEQYAVVSTWGDLRALGFDTGERADNQSVPDSQIWVSTPGPGWQVRFSTSNVCGKGKTFYQHGWEDQMKALGLRALVASSCLKSTSKEPVGAMRMGLKQRNKRGTMKASAFIALLLSVASDTGETWAERVAESNTDFYEKVRVAKAALRGISPKQAKEAAKELLFAARAEVLDEDDEEFEMYSSSEIAIAGGWHPRTPALLGAVKRAAAKIYQTWTWGLGQTFDCEMWSEDMRLDINQVCVPWLPEGDIVVVRYPIRHIHSMRVVTNVHLGGCAEACVAQDVAKSLDGDYDGDRGGFSANPVLVQAVSACTKFWGPTPNPHEENEWVEIGERHATDTAHLQAVLSRIISESSKSQIGPYTNAAMRAAAVRDRETLCLLSMAIQASAEGLKREIRYKNRKGFADIRKSLMEDGPVFMSDSFALKPTETFVEGAPLLDGTRCFLDERYQEEARQFEAAKALERNHREFRNIPELQRDEGVAGCIATARALNQRFGRRMSEIMKIKDTETRKLATDLLYGEMRSTAEADEDRGNLAMALASQVFFREGEDVKSEGRGSLPFIIFPEEMALLGQALWPQDSLEHSQMGRDYALTLEQCVMSSRAREIKIAPLGSKEEKVARARTIELDGCVKIGEIDGRVIGSKMLAALDVETEEPVGIIYPKGGRLRAREIEFETVENHGSYLVIRDWYEV